MNLFILHPVRPVLRLRETERERVMHKSPMPGLGNVIRGVETSLYSVAGMAGLSLCKHWGHAATKVSPAGGPN